MLTVKQLAERWHKTPQTIRRWISGGFVKTLRAGRDHLIEDTEIDRCEALMKQGRFL